MPKLVYVYGDDGHMLDTMLSSLKQNGYSVEYTTVKNEAEKNHIMADIALICTPGRASSEFRAGGLTLNTETMEVCCGEAPLHLTPTEFSLLAYLLKNASRAVPRSELLPAVWGFAHDSGTRVADDTVKRLRKKLRETGVFIETVWGYGFRLREKPALS